MQCSSTRIASWQKTTSPLLIERLAHQNEKSDEEMETEEMDQCMAALVLTSLSLSPVQLKDIETRDISRCQLPPTPDSGTGNSTFSFSPRSVGSPASLEDDDNEKYSNSSLEISPSTSFDEGIGLETQKTEAGRKRKATKVLYQCTWKNCAKILASAAGMTRHVRTQHLGPRSYSEEGYSDGEEEFYYTEIEETNEVQPNIEQAFPSISASSPPTQSHFDMVKNPWLDPITQSFYPPLQASKLNWETAHGFVAAQYTQPKITKARNLQQPYQKKIRSEGKKCRKVYGMENRHLWCTQCRWKKACVRFVD